jgi:hypothetical protein
MIADSVSKAASGGDLGVDDTRFEELMADIDDDEDDFLGGGEKVSKRVCPLSPTSSSSRSSIVDGLMTDPRTPTHTRSSSPTRRSKCSVRRPRCFGSARDLSSGGTA